MAHRKNAGFLTFAFLFDVFKVEKSYEVLVFLLEIVEEDKSPFVRQVSGVLSIAVSREPCWFSLFCDVLLVGCRHRVLRMMADNPPFSRTEDNNLNSDELVERLWKLMKSDSLRIYTCVFVLLVFARQALFAPFVFAARRSLTTVDCGVMSQTCTSLCTAERGPAASSHLR